MKEVIPVNVDKDILDFILATLCLGELEQSLKANGFTMTYSRGSIIYVEPEQDKGDNSANRTKAIKLVADFTKKFKTIDLVVDKNHWSTVTTEMSKLHNEIGKDKLLVRESVSRDKVTIICRESHSKVLKKAFVDKIAESQSLEVKEAYEIDTIDIDKTKLRLLKLTGYEEKIADEYLDLKFDIDEANGKVRIEGPRQQCYEAKLKTYQDVTNFYEKSFPIPDSLSEILDIKEVIERINVIKGVTLRCRMEKIYAVFHIDDGNFIITGINERHVDKLYNGVLKEIITEVRIELNQQAKDVIKTQKWIDFCKKVCQEFKVCVRTNEDLEISILGFNESVSNAQERIRKFLDDNSSGIETLCILDKGVMRYIVEHRKDELAKMETDHSVNITAEEKKDELIISGAKAGRIYAQRFLQRMVDSVSRDKKKVQQPGLHKLATSGKLDSIIRDVEQEHKCRIEKVSEGRKEFQDNDKSLNATSGGTKSDKCGSVTMSWKQGNILAEQDSIQVVSTIGKLYSYDNLKETGGPVDFTKEATDLTSNHDIVRIRTGNLPCDQVILVSCCKWDGENGEAEKKLRSILRECLEQALKLNAPSIAFPIIGTGGLGFPYTKACQIMINEVINVTSGWGPASLNDIRFVVFAQDAKLVNVFQQEFTSAFDKTRGRKPIHRTGSFSRFRNSLRRSFSRIPNTSDKVSVEVLQGDIIDEKTDAIVNLNAPNMDMQKAGALSKVVADAAGPAVKTECAKLGKQTAGSAVITGAGKLKVKHIIHMISGGGASLQHIQKCIEECLQTAENSKLKSISLPACGTGGLKMSGADSAQATFQALDNVCSNFKHLKKIRIVIFQPDLLAEFNKKRSECGYGAVDENTRGQLAKSAKSDKKSANADEASKATIELNVYGKSKEAVDEAMTAFTRQMNETCMTRSIEDDKISNLNENKRKVLKAKANDLDVEITFDDSIPRIEFRGNREDIKEIYDLSLKEIQSAKPRKEKSHRFSQIGADMFGTFTRKDIIPLPKEWCPMPMTKNGEKEKVHLATLVEGSAEYQNVLKMFQQTGGTGRIIKIERIQNPGVYRQYALHKQEMDEENKGKGNERQLFHGTEGRNVNDINTRGFNRSFCGANCYKTTHGKGVYFAKEASHSYKYAMSDASNNRHMYVALVLVGKYTTGSQDMKEPPYNPNSDGRRFDSTADTSDSDASIFVVFHDTQCYPQYLITFQDCSK